MSAPVCDVFDLGCKARETAGQVLAGLVAQIAQGAADLVVTTASWWAGADSVDPRDPAVLAAQQVTTPLALALLVGGVLLQAARMILSRKAEPLAAVAAALLRYAAVSALGLTVLHMALQAGDVLARQLLGDAANNFALYMVDALRTPGQSAITTLLVSCVAAVLSLVQWTLMALRQAGLLVLAAMLPLAAAGPRAWLLRLLAWLLALAAYKPAAAFIYYIGFSYLSSTSSNAPGGVGAQVTGLMVLMLAVLAMPLLMRFFSWSGSAVAGSGGGSAFAGAAGAVAFAPGLLRTSGVQQAAALDATGPGTAALGAAAGPAAGAVVPAAAGAAAAGVAAARAAGDELTDGEPDDGSGR